MKSELTMQIQEWINNEADAFEPELEAARKKSMSKLPLYMVISIAAMCILGFAVGYDVQYVMRVHLPIGVGIAIFIALYIFWQKNSVINKKTVVKAYQNGAVHMTKEEQGLFCAQMSQGNYGESIYQQSINAFPTKVIIGSEYWVCRNGSTSSFEKSRYISRVYLKQANARVTTQKTPVNVKKNVTIGMDLVVEYIEDSGASKGSETVMFFDNSEQATPVLALIRKHCPHIDMKQGSPSL